ncbi:MAG: hypothetical protein ACRD2W_05965 [Acidimicrobiales bacterium]
MPLFGRRRPSANEIEELQVVAAVLAACGDPRSRQLFEQFGTAKSRNRTETANGFTVEPSGKPDRDLAVELDEDVASQWIIVHDVGTKEPLQFRVVVRAGGRFGALEARAPGGTWPSAWRLDGVELAQSAHGALKLPATASEG